MYQNRGSASATGPDAMDDIEILTSGQDSRIIYVLDNDFDRNGNGLTLQSVSEPTHGSATINEDSSVTYTLEDFGFAGDDVFSYVIRDENNQTDSANIGIKVQGSQAPINQQTRPEEELTTPEDRDATSLPHSGTSTPLSEQPQSLPEGALPEVLPSPPVEQPQDNQLPVAEAGESMTVDEGTFVILKGTESSDPDGDSLTYSWTQIEGSAVRLSDPISPTTSFLAPKVTPESGDIKLVFRLTVDDGIAGNATDTVQIYVVNFEEEPEHNSPPVADAGEDMIMSEGSNVTLDGSASSDPDGDSITYSWNLDTPAANSFTSTLASPNFGVPDIGSNESVTFVFELTVDDGNGEYDSDRVSVTVQQERVNQAPVANAGLSQTVEQNTTVTLNGTGSYDPDGSSLIFSWNQTYGTPVSLSEGTSAEPLFDTPLVSEEEQLTFELTVSDGALTSIDVVDIFVNPPAASDSDNLTPATDSNDPDGASEDPAGSGSEGSATNQNNDDGDQEHQGHNDDKKHKSK